MGVTRGVVGLVAASLVVASPVGASPRRGDPRGFTRNVGGTSISTDRAVAIDGHGDTLVAGFTDGAIPGATEQYAGGFDDGFVVKYSPAGRRVWAHLIGSNADDVALGVGADSQGDVYVAGATQGVVCGARRSTSDWDAFVVAYSPNGREQWCRSLGSRADDRLFGVAVSANGAVTIAGDTTGRMPGAAQRNAGASDAWWARYSATGRLEVVRQLGSAADDYATGVAVDAHGNTFIEGGTDGLRGHGDPTFGYFDAFVARFDSVGRLRWLHTVGTPNSSDDDEGTAIAVDQHDDVYLAGYTEGHIIGAPEPPASDSDGFVAKFKSTGTRMWTHQLGAPVIADAYGIASSADGRAYLVGGTASALPGSGRYHGGDGDGFVATYSPSGQPGPVRLVGTTGTDAIEAAAAAPAGQVALSGFTTGHLAGARPPIASAQTGFVETR